MWIETRFNNIFLTVVTSFGFSTFMNGVEKLCYVWALSLQLTIAIEMFDIVKFIEQIKEEGY